MARRSKHKAQSMRLEDQHTVTTERPTVTEEQIRRRAHQLYLARGQMPGDSFQDWLQAEKELRTELAHPYPAGTVIQPTPVKILRPGDF